MCNGAPSSSAAFILQKSSDLILLGDPEKDGASQLATPYLTFHKGNEVLIEPSILMARVQLPPYHPNPEASPVPTVFLCVNLLSTDVYASHD